MFLQIRGTSKSFTASQAFVGSFFCVRAHMELQIAAFDETTATTAFEWFLTWGFTKTFNLISTNCWAYAM